MDAAVVVSDCVPKRWLHILLIEELKHEINVHGIFIVSNDSSRAIYRKIYCPRGLWDSTCEKSSLGPLLENTPIWHNLVIFNNSLSDNPSKCSNTLKTIHRQFSDELFQCV